MRNLLIIQSVYKKLPKVLRLSLVVFICVAVLHPLFVNERPIYCVVNGETHFPLFRGLKHELGIGNWKMQNTNWLTVNYEKKFQTLIPYSYYSIDVRNSNYVSPFKMQSVDHLFQRHWFGTDQLGRDVLAGMAHGSWVALRIGFLSMLIALIIGLFFGVLAGYYGDQTIKWSWWNILMLIPGLILGVFYSLISRRNAFVLKDDLWPQVFFSLLLFVLIVIVFQGLANLLEKYLPFKGKKKTVPFDFIIMRGLEVYKAIPALFILLAVLSILKDERIINVVLLIGLLSWPSITRYMRAELLKIREMDYILSAKAIGLEHWRILIRHAVPNAIGPVLIVIAFGMAAAILLEASLSFLGIGLPADEQSWGSLLSQGRLYMKAWWLSLFPGLAIFWILYVLNALGDQILRNRR